MDEFNFSPARIRFIALCSVGVYVLSLLDRYNKREKMTKETKMHKIVYYLLLTVEFILICMGILLIYNPKLWKIVLDINVIFILIDTILWVKYRREED
jgi:uncharacterized membrane protein